MKILLDEHFGQDIAILLHDVGEVHTVRDMGFSGMANGQLLRAAEGSNFDALITADANMVHQQNEATLPIAVIVIRSYGNRPERVRPFVPRIVDLLSENHLPKRFHVLTSAN